MVCSVCQSTLHAIWSVNVLVLPHNALDLQDYKLAPDSLAAQNRSVRWDHLQCNLAAQASPEWVARAQDVPKLIRTNETELFL
jgi:hypothetical protein